jgi:hypothetical protein
MISLRLLLLKCKAESRIRGKGTERQFSIGSGRCIVMISETQARLPKSHSNDTVSAETLNDACVNADFLPGKLNDVSTNVIH